MPKRIIYILVILFAAAGNMVCSAQNQSRSGEFTPGDRIIFEDNFGLDTLGAFPARWHLSLCTKRAVAGYPESPLFCKVQNDSNEHALVMENSTRFMDPNMLEANNLPETFAVDFDFTYDSLGRCAELVYYMSPNKDSCLKTIVHMHYLGTLSVVGRNDQNLLTVKYPNFNSGVWHHMAIVYRSRAMQIYIDKYPVASLADSKFTPYGVSLSCIPPIRYKHFRVSTGGAMAGAIASAGGSKDGGANTEIKIKDKGSVAQILTEKKFVTHDILFDRNKSTITQESMTFIADLVQLMKSNPTVKLEIGGHTDNAGDPKVNMKLSQDRADEVKKQLVLGGIAESRLTAIGFGSSKPLQSNKTETGRANNRRVEFVRK